jgi:hypothetical protein
MRLGVVGCVYSNTLSYVKNRPTAWQEGGGRGRHACLPFSRHWSHFTALTEVREAILKGLCAGLVQQEYPHHTGL